VIYIKHAGKTEIPNESGHAWTARYRLWKLIFTRKFATKKQAMEFKKWLKPGS